LGYSAKAVLARAEYEGVFIGPALSVVGGFRMWVEGSSWNENAPGEIYVRVEV
jgi:hypothetical protein